MIGINDVWRQVDSPEANDIHVPLDKFTATYRELLDKTRAGLKGMIMATPYVIEPDRSDRMREMMDRYSATVVELAAEYDCILVRTQSAFDAWLEHGAPGELAEDRVHPNLVGHMIIARAWLQAVGFDEFGS